MTRHDPDRDAAVLTFIEDHIDEHGYPPSVRSIADAVGLSSPSSALFHLRKLEGQGKIARDPERARSIRLVKPDVDMTRALAEHLCRSQHGMRPRRNPPCRAHLRTADYLVFVINESPRRESPVRLVPA